MTIENIELLYTPLTKQLLINFVKVQYEENANTSDESLKAEFMLLYKNNELDQLILAECLTFEPKQKANSNKTRSNNESSNKPLTKERLITLIKSKYQEVDGIEYDYMVRDYQLLKSSKGLFSVIMPTK